MLKPPVRNGLRVINKNQDVSKINLVVPAGDELEVSEEVAAQIVAQTSDFVPTDSEAAARAVPYPPVEDAVEVEEPAKRPAKRAAKRKP